VSFETVLGLAVHCSPLSCWDITGQQNLRKTISGMRQDGAEPAEADET